MNTATVTQQQPRIRSTCDACLEAKVRCSRDRPTCRRCAGHGRECIYSFKRRLGRPRGSTKNPQATSNNDVAHTAASSPSQSNTDQTMPGEVPFTTNTDDFMLTFDHNLDFVGDPSNQDSLFPLWLSSIDGQEMVDPMTDDPMMHELSEAISASFSGSMSDTGFNISPRRSNRLPGLVDDSSTASLAAGMENTHFGPNTEHILPILLSRKLTNTSDEHANSRQSPPKTSSPSVRSASSAKQDPPRSSDMLLPSRCDCYPQILQWLSVLKDERRGFLASRVDSIMKLEQEIRIQTLRMMACNECLHERSRTLLLVGVVLEIVVDLLESAVSYDADMETSSSSSSLSPTSTAGRLDNTLLQLGEFEISGEEKLSFLRHLVNTRLHQISNIIRQLHEHMQICRTLNSNFKVAVIIMAELSQRVHTLMNGLEG